MVCEFLLVLIGLYVLWYIKDQKDYHGFPPGPFRVPLLGNLIQLGLQPTKLPSTALRGISRIHGDIITVSMGMIDFVVFSSYETITELLQMEDVANRKMFKYMQERSEGGNVGLIISNGDTWHNLRRFTIRTLREFGFGKSASMDTVINSEALKFVQSLKETVKSQTGGVVYVESGDMFDSTVINILWRLVTGKEYELNDARITKMLKLSNEYVRSARVDDISICYPVLRDWFPNMTGKTIQKSCTTNLKRFLEKVIQEHIDVGSFKENPRSFIDVFLKKIEESNTNSPDFNSSQHVYTLLDLFQAGSETTSKTLTFIILHLIRNPSLQENLYREILAVFEKHPTQNVTSLSKDSFPLAQAIILETIRYNPVVPIPAPYECYHDLNFRGYKIPKGTPLLVNLEAIHFQESIWGDPNNFRPERFIKPDGNSDTQFADFFVGFGKGKRTCIGKILADVTLFIYLITVVKKFQFRKAEGKPLPSVVAKPGLTYSPEAFWAQIVERI